MAKNKPNEDEAGCMSTTASSASSSADSPPPAPPPQPHVSARTRYQLPFPHTLERLFAPLDDYLISILQRRTAGAVHLFCMTLTFFTSIEVSLVAPPALYALGYDAAGGLAASVLIVLGIISQIPKKFIFRARPWMVGRALPIRRDKTSSFPSRAVVCAVVYSWLIAQGLDLEGILQGQLSPVCTWAGIVFMASLAAFARINVGAHYPSDTLLGFVLGCVIIKVGVRFEEFWQRVGCGVDTAYPISSEFFIDSRDRVRQLASWQSLGFVTLISSAMTLVSIQGFWVKCSYVYGLLMSSAAFRATFVCCGRTGGVAGVGRVVDHGGFREHVHATAMFTILLIFGMITRGKKGMLRVVTFSLIYLGALIGVLYWRLRPELRVHWSIGLP